MTNKKVKTDAFAFSWLPVQMTYDLRDKMKIWSAVFFSNSLLIVYFIFVIVQRTFEFLDQKMNDNRKMTILCSMIENCQPSDDEIRVEIRKVENRDRILWTSGKKNLR